MFRSRKSREEREAEADVLITEGYEALEQGRWKDAIRIARRIRPLRNSGYFDILARAQWKSGRRKHAIRTLERGVTVYPQVAILWSYLGEYYSNTGDYDRAVPAFERAASGIAGHRWLADYNIALVEWRRKRPEQALQKLWLIPLDVDRPPRWAVEDLRARVLADLGRGDEAVETADEALALFARYSRIDPPESISYKGGSIDPPPDGADPSPAALQPEDRATHARIMATRAICLRVQGKPDEALEQCWEAIRTHKSDRDAGGLIRDLTDARSDRSREWKLILEGRRRDGEGVRGFYTHYVVIADDAQEAFDYARAFEPEEYRGELRVSEAKPVRAAPNEPKGVCRATGYAFFPLER